MHPKFLIVTSPDNPREGRLAYGRVCSHRELIEGHVRVHGGGWYDKDDDKKTMLLYGSSGDYGDPRLDFLNRIPSELTASEFHRIAMARCQVFVVEQRNACQEVDETDVVSYHLYLEDGGKILSYARIFQDNDRVSHIGRVLSTIRGQGYGARIMVAVIDACRTHFGLAPIVLESQYAVRGFYAKHGFKEVSDVFLENDIPHVMMRRTVQREETV